MSPVTRILSAIEQGDAQAPWQFLLLVYDELRKLAAQRLSQQKAGQGSKRRRWCTRHICGWWTWITRSTGRGHFFAAAAEAMRHPGGESAAAAAGAALLANDNVSLSTMAAGGTG